MHKQAETRPIFDIILLAAIDETLAALGESAKTSIQFHLERTYSLKKQDIPNRIDDFSDALQKIFGVGARHLEILCMKNLHAKVNEACEWCPPVRVKSEVALQEYVRIMKRQFEEAEKNEDWMEVMINATEEQEQYS